MGRLNRDPFMTPYSEVSNKRASTPIFSAFIFHDERSYWILARLLISRFLKPINVKTWTFMVKIERRQVNSVH